MVIQFGHRFEKPEGQKGTFPSHQFFFQRIFLNSRLEIVFLFFCQIEA